MTEQTSESLYPRTDALEATFDLAPEEYPLDMIKALLHARQTEVELLACRGELEDSRKEAAFRKRQQLLEQQAAEAAESSLLTVRAAVIELLRAWDENDGKRFYKVALPSLRKALATLPPLVTAPEQKTEQQRKGDLADGTED